MSGSDTQQAKVKAYLYSLPGKRGIDIPEAQFDALHAAASGETLPVWGRHPTPEQMQYLHDNELHHPAKVKELYGNLQHPDVPGVKVSEYPAWEQAYSVVKDHGKPS